MSSVDAIPPEVAEVVSYRRAARLIVRDDSRSVRDRVLAVVNLAERGRRTAELKGWVAEAIWREAEVFILTGRIPEPPTSDPVIGTLRQLRRRGLERCPTCRRSLPDEAALERQEGLVWASILEHALSEKAGAP